MSRSDDTSPSRRRERRTVLPEPQRWACPKRRCEGRSPGPLPLGPRLVRSDAEDFMAPSSWDEGIDTGVDAMDAEHRLQVSLVNALEVLVRQRAEAALVERTLSQLVDYTSVHFV